MRVQLTVRWCASALACHRVTWAATSAGSPSRRLCHARRWPVVSRSSAASSGSPAMSSTRPFSRLPSCVTPSNYALRLRPDLAKFRFEACALVAVQVYRLLSAYRREFRIVDRVERAVCGMRCWNWSL